MRVIKKYYFDVGTKIPYSDLPYIVHAFLDKQGLTSHRFLYYFEDILTKNGYYEDKLKACGCAKMLKDCSALGELRFYETEYNIEPFISNIDSDGGCSEEHILPLMKKIHRRYGLSNSNLYYYDVDFFNEVIPFVRNYGTEILSGKDGQTRCGTLNGLEDQPLGSGIVLSRSPLESYLCLSVDLLHKRGILDDKPYFEAMAELLPNVKVTESLTVYLTEAEKQKIAETDRLASGTLEKCKIFLADRIFNVNVQNRMPSEYRIAPTLKKLAKRYGYKYRMIDHSRVFVLEKRTSRGNVLYLEACSGFSHFDISFSLSFCGIGFNHVLNISQRTPTNQQEADECMEQIMSVINQFEMSLLPSLDSLYPITPDWFVPY